jgi:8-oxo-dGTP pyrophosphatase MutT (NUDIX family)
MNQVVYFQHTPVHFKYGIERTSQNCILVDSSFSFDELLKQISIYPSGFDLIFKDDTDRNHFVETQFTCIEAAGGIVLNPEEKLLFIFRRGKWDLPKGKREIGEDEEMGARREIEEETGVTGLHLINKLIETYHVYFENEKPVLKTSHWYLYKIENNQDTHPQTEEDITETTWFGKDELDIPLSNTYENIIHVVNAYLANLSQ